MSKSELKEVNRDTYMAYMRHMNLNHSNIKDNPVSGDTISAMQSTLDGKMIAQAVYSKPVKAEGVKVITTYYVTKDALCHCCGHVYIPEVEGDSYPWCSVCKAV